MLKSTLQSWERFSYQKSLFTLFLERKIFITVLQGLCDEKSAQFLLSISALLFFS